MIWIDLFLVIILYINIYTSIGHDQWSSFISIPSGFNVQTYARKENFVIQNNMRNPRSIRSITHISNGVLYIITYVTPKEVSAANTRLVTALIDIGGDGTVDIHQPILGTWESNTELMYSYLAPTSIAIDYSGTNQNVYFSTYISTLVCRNVHDQVLAMTDRVSDRLDMNQCDIYYNWRNDTGEYNRFDNGDHGRHFAAFNRDTNELCIAMGVDCDLCDACLDPINNPSPGCTASLPQSQILCCPTDNAGTPLTSVEQCTVKANGMRNTVGFDFHPVDNQMWWTENQQGLQIHIDCINDSIF